MYPLYTQLRGQDRSYSSLAPFANSGEYGTTIGHCMDPLLLSVYVKNQCKYENEYFFKIILANANINLIITFSKFGLI